MQSIDVTVIQQVETAVTIHYEDEQDLESQINDWRCSSEIMQNAEVTNVEVMT